MRVRERERDRERERQRERTHIYEKETCRGESSERDAGRAQSRVVLVLRLLLGLALDPKVKAPGESHFVSLHKTFRLFRHHMPREKNNRLLGVISSLKTIRDKKAALPSIINT